MITAGARITPKTNFTTAFETAPVDSGVNPGIDQSVFDTYGAGIDSGESWAGAGYLGAPDDWPEGYAWYQ